LICLGAGWTAYDRLRAPDADQLIAQAYAAQRPFEFRLRGASYGPPRAVRAVESRMNRPESLLAVEAIIARELKRAPDSTKWLAYRARAEILNREADEAIATLRRTLDETDEDPRLFADLGLAYALRAQFANRAGDYGSAIEYLGRGIKFDPNDVSTLFNRAIAYERMFLYDLAADDWARYLALDSQGGFADEAKARLWAIEQKRKVQQEAQSRITSDPEALLRRIERGEDVQPESYYNIALTQWLPRRWKEPKYGQGLETLATLAYNRHHDRWLRDVLTASGSQHLQRGYTALGEAVAANLEDAIERGIARARDAGTLLNEAGDSAGALRADAELVYGLQRSWLAKECAVRGRAVERAASKSGYFWILGQTRVSMGTCHGILGDSGRMYRDLTLALKTAQDRRYQTLALRADAILTGEQGIAGNLLTLWDRSRVGLKQFWDNAHPPIRAQQYYNLLRQAAEQLGHNEAAYSFARASAGAAIASGYRLIEATGRIQAAKSAAAAGYNADVASQYHIAERLLAEIGDSKATSGHRLFAEIDRARAETQAGSAEASLRRLQPLRAQVQDTDSLLTQLQFHLELGNALHKLGNSRAARAEWTLAIDRHERQLRSLTELDERLLHLQVAGNAHRNMVALNWGDNDGVKTALEMWEHFRDAEWPATWKREPLPLHRLRRETFVTFVDLPDGVAVWVFDDRGVQGTRTSVGAEKLRRTTERFLRLCADPRSDFAALKSVGQQLYTWLLAPHADRLESARTLVFDPEGPGAAIPFAALTDLESRFLGERFDIVVGGGVRDYLRRALHPGLNPDARALVIAAPELSGDAARSFPPLSGAAVEGDRVAARFRNAKLFGGREATMAAVTQHQPHAELFHFAGHGLSQAGNGGLLLAPSGISELGSEVLDGRRLAGQNWSRCRLAVLSACSTGTGESGGPVNPESLVRRLLWAGVPRVVASSWRVDSQTTLELMEAFYEHLLSASDPASALRQAGRRIRDREGTRHPYYWAGFQLFGSR
jgi:CHAT domain-containing protein/tetratricopeptide (TPR) repeat protein